MIAEILRLVAGGEMLAGGQEEVVVGRLHEAAAEMIAAGERAFLMEYHLDRVEPRRAVIHQPGAGERRARAAADRLGVTEIDRVVLAVVAVERDVVQAALARGEDFRHARERGRELAVRADNAHAPGALGDQHAAIGQEGERPGMDEALRHRFHRDVAGGRMKHLRIAGPATRRNEPGCHCQCPRPHAKSPARANPLAPPRQRCVGVEVPASLRRVTWV